MDQAQTVRRIVGPPGTGKTTYLASRVRAAAEQYGPQGALVCSLTRAAAEEAGGRDTGILDPDMVGTLHAHCYRALGRPKLVDAKAIETWNNENPALTLSGDGLGDSDETGQRMAKTVGDRQMARLDLARSKRLAEAMIPSDVAAFGKRWAAFKAEAEVVDFTDLIELGISSLPLPPHGPSVIYVDEAQDLSRLELDLVERWAAHVEHVRLVGDADQCLYSWRGADPAVLAGRPDKVLGQSHRVPRAVHEVAMNWIARSASHRPIEYLPTAEPGTVTRSLVTYRQPERLLSLIEDRLSAGQSVMLLGACSYMLDPACKVLRNAGIPFHNPFAARWNPLTPNNGVSARERLLGFVRAESLADFKAFVPLLRSCDKDGSGPLVRGAKKAIEELADDAPDDVAARVIREAFRAEALPLLARGGDLGPALEWFEANLLPSKGETALYPLRVLRQRGLDVLAAEPDPRKQRRGWAVIGSVHSVKGGEADVVVVWPDLSPSGWQEFNTPGWAHRDAIWRLFYVAATRARRELVIGAPSGGCCVQI